MKLDFAKLDELLFDRCWSLAELSRRAGLSPVTIFKLKNGTNKSPSRLTMAKLAKALEVKPTELMLQE